MIGEYRMIPKGTKVWSTQNQTNILFDEDVIFEITNTCYGSDVVFGIQKQLIFDLTGHIPTLINRGYDEWSVSYSKTLLYTIPEAKF